jgi:hypothetical protein
MKSALSRSIFTDMQQLSTGILQQKMNSRVEDFWLAMLVFRANRSMYVKGSA